jgi:glycerol-3-phosphate acyltransferase PlsY
MPWIEEMRSLNWSQAGCVFFSAYALGCFATGYYLVRWRTGKDLRELGSGSTGARNASRILGRTGFFLTVLGDFGKGALAVGLTKYFANDPRLAAVAMVAVVAGHVWPAQLRFHGGKGMATSLGALLFFDAGLAAAFLGIFAAGWLLLRRTVLPGLFAMAALPLVSAWWQRGAWNVTGLFAMAAVVLLAHRANLVSEVSRLVKGSEMGPQEDRPPL